MFGIDLLESLFSIRKINRKSFPFQKHNKVVGASYLGGNGMSCDDVTCGSNAQCTTTTAGAQCICNEGFVGNGVVCEKPTTFVPSQLLKDGTAIFRFF